MAKLDNFLKRYKPFFTPSSFIFAGVIILEIIILVFLRSFISGKAQSIKVNNEDIQRRTQLLEIQSRLKEQSAAASLIGRQLNQMLASKDDLLNLAREFNQLANLSNVNLAFSFTGEVKEDQDSSFGRAGFTMTVDGKFSDLTSFLKRAETSRFIVSIINFDLTSRDASSSMPYRLFARGQILYHK